MFQLRPFSRIGRPGPKGRRHALTAAASLLPEPVLSEGLIGEETVALSCVFHTECRDENPCRAADLHLNLEGLSVELTRGTSGLVATLKTEDGEIETTGFVNRHSLRVGGESPRAYHLLTTMTDGARYTVHGRRIPVSTTNIGRCE